MSSSTDYCPGEAAFAAGTARSPRKFWPSIVRIAVVEVVLLLALAGVFIAYLNWSSEATFAEFLAANGTGKAQATPVAPPNAAGGRPICNRSA
jgi:hypothetical protein